jgi:hypothetical protein
MGTAGFISDAMVSLVVADDDFIPRFALGSRTLLSDGTFAFFNLPPGRYMIHAGRGAKPPGPLALPSTLDRLPSALAETKALWAAQLVEIRDGNITGLTMVLREGPLISGRVVFEAPAPSPVPVRIRLLREDDTTGQVWGGGVPSTVARVSAAGDFATSRVPAGHYFIRSEGLASGWVMQSAVVNGRDMADVPIALEGSDMTGVVVTFTNRATEVEGKAIDSNGADPTATVMVFPVDRSMWVDFGGQPRRLRATRADRAGRYSFIGLPTGSYFVAAIPDEFAADWAEPDFLDSLSRSAARVQLGDGDRKTLDVRTAQVLR